MLLVASLCEPFDHSVAITAALALVPTLLAGSASGILFDSEILAILFAELLSWGLGVVSTTSYKEIGSKAAWSY